VLGVDGGGVIRLISHGVIGQPGDPEKKAVDGESGGAGGAKYYLGIGGRGPLGGGPGHGGYCDDPLYEGMVVRFVAR